MRLNGKKALITGASRGIGRAIALAFAQEGADLAVTARKEASLQDTVKEVERLGRRAYPMGWDVSDVSQAGARLEHAKDILGGLDIVVNNAGVVRLPPDHPDPTEEALWDYIMGINLKGLYFICRRAAEMMKEQKSGIIINIASDAGLRAAPGPYGISKWGVIGLTRGLGKELAPHGIRVNAIAPGPVATEMMNWHPGDPIASPSLPLGRYSLPEEIAAVAVFLASEDSAAVVGETIVVNTANS